MNAIPVLVGLLPLALLAVGGWLLYRAGASRATVPSGDPAVVIRRFFLYGLLYTTLLLGAQGSIELVREVLAGSDRSNATLARAMALLVVGAPAATLLVRHVDGRLRTDPDEAASTGWALYLNAALATTLLGAMIEGHEALRTTFDRAVQRPFEPAALGGAIIWATLWAGHWFGLRRRHRPANDLDLAVGTIVGLVPLAVGLAGLARSVLHGGYRAVVDDGARLGRPGAATWAAAALVGGLAWAWYWLAHYRRSDRSILWYVVVVPIGALAGFVATVAMAAALGRPRPGVAGRPTGGRHCGPPLRARPHDGGGAGRWSGLLAVPPRRPGRRPGPARTGPGLRLPAGHGIAGHRGGRAGGAAVGPAG